MLCYMSHFFKDVQSHWFLKEKPQMEGKSQKENLSTWQIKLTGKDAKRRVAHLLLQPHVIAGPVCSHPGLGLPDSPWLCSVVWHCKFAAAL